MHGLIIQNLHPVAYMDDAGHTGGGVLAKEEFTRKTTTFAQPHFAQRLVRLCTALAGVLIDVRHWATVAWFGNFKHRIANTDCQHYVLFPRREPIDHDIGPEASHIDIG